MNSSPLFYNIGIIFLPLPLAFWVELNIRKVQDHLCKPDSILQMCVRLQVDCITAHTAVPSVGAHASLQRWATGQQALDVLHTPLTLCFIPGILFLGVRGAALSLIDIDSTFQKNCNHCPSHW